MACLQYQSGKVKYSGKTYERRDLLKMKSEVLGLPEEMIFPNAVALKELIEQ